MDRWIWVRLVIVVRVSLGNLIWVLVEKGMFFFCGLQRGPGMRLSID